MLPASQSSASRSASAAGLSSSSLLSDDRLARVCLSKAAQDNGVHEDWRRVAAADACFSSYDAILPRFYLFTLKGYAYLQMRLGDVEEGRAAVLKLLELDPSDKLGAKVLLGVLARMGQADDD